MPLANTGTLSTNFNVSPYYDDYDESKNYYRTLYKPGLAVQGRELTQMQTGLQTQIDRFAEHIFKEGSVVKNNALKLERMSYVKLQDADSAGDAITAANFVDTLVTGGTSGMTAIVLASGIGTEATSPTQFAGPNTLYVRYTNSGANTTTSTFLENEILTANTGITANSFLVSSTGTGLYCTLNEGIIYAKDHFIRVETQSLVVSRYAANTNVNGIVGYDIAETIVSFTDDNTLLDPAQGAYNYAAPGADRLKLEPILAIKDIAETDLATFIQRATIRNGRLAERLDKPVYNVIKDYIARRTFDESGNYLVHGYDVTTEEANTTHMYVLTSPGKAYVQGYDNELLLTSVQASEKATSTTSVNNAIISSNYGNYVNVTQVVGDWGLSDGAAISLRDAVSEAANTDVSATTVQGTEIGTARVRAVEWVSGVKGSPSAAYRVYLYDVNMSTNPFADTRALYYNTTADGFADIALTGGVAVLQDTAQNDLLFYLPAKNIKEVNNTSYTYWNSFTAQIAQVAATTGAVSAPGSSTYNVSDSGETQLAINDNFHAYVGGSTTVYANTGHSVTMPGSGTTHGFGAGNGDKYNIGERLRVNGAGNIYQITDIATDTLTFDKTLASESGPVQKVFAPGQFIPMEGYNGSAAGGTLRVTTITNSSQDVEFDIKEDDLKAAIDIIVITKYNSAAAQAQSQKTLFANTVVEIDISGHGTGAAGPWNLGVYDGYVLKEVRQSGSTFTALTDGTDVTTNFELDTGMRDNFYAHAKLKLKDTSSYTPTGYLLGVFDRFKHAATGHFFSVESYPNAATNPENIPIYKSPTTGLAHDLRNYIDARPHYIDSVVPGIATIAGLVTNPANGTIMNSISASGVIAPNENVDTDYIYYLPRKDRIVVNSTGEVNIKQGVPSLNPQTPAPVPDALTLAVMSIAAFPSLTYKDALLINRTDLANRTEPVRQLRYTMRDIGVIKDRVDNLEYYTSLSLLEMATESLTISDVSGINRFKNGILVDQFSGHGVGDTRKSDYKISVDPERKEIRPTFKLDDVPLEYTSGTGLREQGSLIMFDYTHNQLISQPNGSDTRSATSGFYKFTGSLTLTPATDNWVDKVNAPRVNVNFDNNTDAWERLSNAWGTQWNDWQTVWTGQTSASSTAGFLTTTTATTTTNQARTGTRLSVVPETRTQSAGESVRNVNIIPFMRSRLVRFFGEGLKPSTRIFPFFDDLNVILYCRGNNSAYTAPAAYGDALTTDSAGNIYGEFRIPNDSVMRFATGRTQFKLSSSIIGSVSATTFAVVDYNASGLTQEVSETIISTRSPRVSMTSVNDNRTTSNSRITDVSGTVPPPVTIVRVIPQPPAFPVSAPAVAAATWMDEWDEGDNPGADNSNDSMDGGEGGDDPIAQTFLVRTDDSSQTVNGSGAFLTKIDLYFAAKDSTLPIFVQIREVDASTAQITNRIVPFGEKTILASAVNVNATSPTTATTVEFDTPVFLLNNTEYAFVIKPAANSPNYSTWISRIGEDDIATGRRITQQPYSGILFISSNDRTWTPIQEEDIKFDMYFADFSAGTNTRTALFTNKDIDFFSVANTTTLFTGVVGEFVHGETTLTLAASLTGSANGDTLVGTTSSANGTITDNTNAPTYTLRSVNPLVGSAADKFVDGAPGETITLYQSGVATAFTSTLSSQSTPSGVVTEYDDFNFDTIKLQLDTITGTFANSTWVAGQIYGGEALITNRDPINIDYIHAKVGLVDPIGTSVSGSMQFSSTDTVTTAASAVTINLNDNTGYTNRYYSLGNALEGGTKSSQLSLAMTRSPTNKYHAPVIDKERVSLYTVENLVNNLTTNEESNGGGDSQARYITKTVTLADGQDAEDLKAFITAYKPSSAGVNVYYKILHGEDGDTIDQRPWVNMTQVTNGEVVSDSENEEDYKEYEYTIPTANLLSSIVQYTNTQGVVYAGFKRFAIKIVLTSSNTVKVPRVTDLRVVALQA